MPSRTVIVAVITWIGSATARYGYDVDPNILADVLINIFPLLMIGMRAITRTPLRKST